MAEDCLVQSQCLLCGVTVESGVNRLGETRDIDMKPRPIPLRECFQGCAVAMETPMSRLRPCSGDRFTFSRALRRDCSFHIHRVTRLALLSAQIQGE
ncbi:hypothetical protein MHYP_G00207860 [Metynnis hypsauchen]